MPTLKTTVTTIQFAIKMLSYRCSCAVVLYYVLWGSGRNAGSLNVLLYFVLPSPLLCFFCVSATFRTQRGTYTSSILFFSAWLALCNNTSLFLLRCSACFLQRHLTSLRFICCEDMEKALLNQIWPVRLKRIYRNVIWIGFQTTYECSSKQICTNR